MEPSPRNNLTEGNEGNEEGEEGKEVKLEKFPTSFPPVGIFFCLITDSRLEASCARYRRRASLRES